MKKKIVIAAVTAALVLSMAFVFAACDNGGEDPGILFGKELLPLTAQVDILQNLETGSADIARSPLLTCSPSLPRSTASARRRATTHSSARSTRR